MFPWDRNQSIDLDSSIYLKGTLFIYQFHATGLFLYNLKTPENHRFSDVFRGIETSSMKRVNELIFVQH